MPKKPTVAPGPDPGAAQRDTFTNRARVPRVPAAGGAEPPLVFADGLAAIGSDNHTVLVALEVTRVHAPLDGGAGGVAFDRREAVQLRLTLRCADELRGALERTLLAAVPRPPGRPVA